MGRPLRVCRYSSKDPQQPKVREEVELKVSDRPAEPGQFNINGFVVEVPAGEELAYDICDYSYVLTPKLPQPQTVLVTFRFTNEHQQRVIEALIRTPGFVEIREVPPAAPAAVEIRPDESARDARLGYD